MASTAELRDKLRAALAGELPAAVALRRELHARPDLSGYEQPTATRVAAALGAPDARPAAGTGRLIRIGPSTGPAIAIRAELDGLPVVERTGVPFAARNGAMHACGHDVHLAALTALARAARQVELPVALLAILQPREETNPSGARDLVDSGVLLPHRVGAFIGVHVQPVVEAGAVSTGAGVVNAAADEFEVVVTGRGGHGAYPHLTDDPVPAIAEIVTSLQQLVSRKIDPRHAAVVTIGMLRAGEAPNVIPDTARAAGTLRSTDPADRESLRVGVRQVSERVAAAFNCTARVEIRAGEPILVNDGPLATATDVWLAAAGVPVVEPPRSCGSDDFSFFRTAAPTLMMFLGTHETAGTLLHSADFLPPDGTVGAVAEAMLAGYLGGLDMLFPGGS
jgi:amidohydrolase